MSAGARTGGLRLLACAFALLAWAGVASAGFDKEQRFDTAKGRGLFRVVLAGTDLKVDSITARFAQEHMLGIPQEMAPIHDWYVRIQFFGIDGKEYGKAVVSKTDPGPDRSGKFHWAPKGGFQAEPGKVTVTLFGRKTKGGKVERLMWITGDIFQR
jgi:hypothetical protein